MFDKILVGLDRSAIGAEVFAEALALAQRTHASLHLLHLLCPEEADCPHLPPISGLEYYPGLDSNVMELYHEQWQLYEAKGLDFLKAHTNLATAAGVPTEFTQSMGSPGRMICEVARNWGANLILVGRRGHVGMREFLMGSVSNYVLHHAPCSVLVVHPTRTDDSMAIASSETDLPLADPLNPADPPHKSPSNQNLSVG